MSSFDSLVSGVFARVGGFGVRNRIGFPFISTRRVIVSWRSKIGPGQIPHLYGCGLAVFGSWCFLT